MKLRPDLLLHLKMGTALAVLLVVVVVITFYFGGGYAVAFGSAALGVGVELYQKFRKEGVASWDDAVASATIGVVGGLLYEVSKFVS